MLDKEKLRKFLLYFNAGDNYFEESGDDFDDYDIEFEKFIDNSILYDILDDELIPMKRNNDEHYYFVSLIISYGIAHLQRFLRSGNEDSLKKVTNCTNFLIQNSLQDETTALLREYDRKTKSFTGEVSAMNNGMAISLIARVFKITKEERLSNFCEKLANAYYISVEQNGFTRILSNENMWFDEFPLSKYRVLNGKLFALLGLIDYKKLIGNKNFDQLIVKGTNGLLGLLDSFDKKWWSNYFVGDYTYISSAKYHTLHILQLRIIGNYLKSDRILNYSDKFKKYDTTFNRIMSGLVLIYDKLKMNLLK